MPLIKDGTIVSAPWVMIGDEGDLPEGPPVVVTLERWRSDRAALLRRKGPLGIRLTCDQPSDLIAEDLGRFDLVLLEVPRSADDRVSAVAGRGRDPGSRVCAAYWAY